MALGPGSPLRSGRGDNRGMPWNSRTTLGCGGTAVTYWVYILASRRNGTLYVGVTNDLARRIGQHKAGQGGAFTREYEVRALVHAEPFDDIALAIEREKRLKRWRRAWKLALIERENPTWRDLYEDINM